MKRRTALKILNIIILNICFFSFFGNSQESWIRINQLGYLPVSEKIAVFISKNDVRPQKFKLINALTHKPVYTQNIQQENGTVWGMKTAGRLDFSSFTTEGEYYLKCGSAQSPQFTIGRKVYAGISDFLLNYMRQQRCGFNPYFNDSCHTHDGFIADHPTRTGEIIDVTGGWHDATDYLQYTATSANAVYQMLFAWNENPEVFSDQFQASGLSGKNGIADIVDEVRYGIEWLLKMNPAEGEMYNQIADDRDHIGFRLPVGDKASYGNGLYRPVYFVTGKPQGLSKHKNRTTGVSSTAGKFASAFALAAKTFRQSDPEFSALLTHKAKAAYRFALTDMGTTQTACFVSPYFYEEENFVDDLELAAIELFNLTGNEKYKLDAVTWGNVEPVSPWMAFNSARHYQFYPFINMGHYGLARELKNQTDNHFADYMQKGLNNILERAKNDPFRIGIPFIWCSNNLVTAAVMQARLYQNLTGDPAFSKMEAALRDWLLGCNPWGTSMICGLPENGDSPMNPHSSITYVTGKNTLGGLVDGPVYSAIFNGHIGVGLQKEDSYKPFQQGIAVYHDDMGDYTSNEPTMDGTAMLFWYFSWLEAQGLK